MKKSLLFFFSAACFLLAACGDDDAGGPQDTPRFSIAPEALSFSAEGGTGTVAVDCNVLWTVGKEYEAEWLAVAPGSTAAELVVTAAPNETEDSRSCSLLFSPAGLDPVRLLVSQTGSEAPVVLFEFALTSLYQTSLSVDICPDESVGTYCWTLIPDGYTDETLESRMETALRGEAEAAGLSLTEYLAEIGRTASDRAAYRNLSPGTSYILLAAGVGSDAAFTTGVYGFPVETKPVGDDVTFRVTCSSDRSDQAHVTVEAVPSGVFFLTLLTEEEAGALGDDMQTIGRLLAAFDEAGVLEENLYENSFDNTAINLDIDTDYCLLVFGYESGYITSGLSRTPVDKPAPQDPADVTFAFEISDITGETYLLDMHPSAPYYRYAFNSIPAAEVEAAGDAQTACKAHLERTIADYLETYGGTTADFVKNVCVVGDFRIIMTLGLEPSAEYYAYAVAVDPETAAPLSAVSLSDRFRMADPPAVELKAELSIGEYFDGTALFDAYGEAFSSYRNVALVPVSVSPSSNAVRYKTSLFNTSNLNMYLQYGYSLEMIMDWGMMATYTFENTPRVDYPVGYGTGYTIASIAYDANGNQAACRVDLLLSADGASPVEEYEAPSAAAAARLTVPRVIPQPAAEGCVLRPVPVTKAGPSREA